LQFYWPMKKKMRARAGFAVVVSVISCLTLTPTSFIATPAFAQTQSTQPVLSAKAGASGFYKAVVEEV
jgi:hypothetical protein